MSLISLNYVAKNPEKFTRSIVLRTNEVVVLRPLLTEDLDKLTEFLERLSIATRELSTFNSYDAETAKEFCNAINRYDKLRFVVENSIGRIVGLLEFIFDIPEGDIERYAKNGIDLNSEFDCRWGPTLADDYQSKGLGSAVFPIIKEISMKFGKKRIILYGGVLTQNKRAIHYYEKFGFRKVGKFENQKGSKLLDRILNI